MPLASQSPYPIIVYSVANYIPHLSNFWANMWFLRSHLSHFLFLWIDPFFRLNEKHVTFRVRYKHSGTFANCKYEELSYPKKSENVRPNCSNSIENAAPSNGPSPLASYKEVPPPSAYKLGFDANLSSLLSIQWVPIGRTRKKDNILIKIKGS